VLYNVVNYSIFSFIVSSLLYFLFHYVQLEQEARTTFTCKVLSLACDNKTNAARPVDRCGCLVQLFFLKRRGMVPKKFGAAF